MLPGHSIEIRALYPEPLSAWIKTVALEPLLEEVKVAIVPDDPTTNLEEPLVAPTSKLPLESMVTGWLEEPSAPLAIKVYTPFVAPLVPFEKKRSPSGAL